MKPGYKEPYKVGEKYFDNLEEIIIAKTIKNKPKSNNRVMWFSLAAAASVIMCIWFAVSLNKSEDNKPMEQTTVIVKIDDKSTIESSVLVESISSDDLTEVLAEAETIKVEEAVLIEKPVDITDQEMELLMEEVGLVYMDLDEDLLGEIEI